MQMVDGVCLKNFSVELSHLCAVCACRLMDQIASRETINGTFPLSESLMDAGRVMTQYLYT